MVSGPVSPGYTGHQAPKSSSGAPSSHLLIPCPTEGTGQWNLKRRELLEQERLVDTVVFNIPILQMWKHGWDKVRLVTSWHECARGILALFSFFAVVV